MEQYNQQEKFPQEAQTTQVKYAGFWIRWIANFIDGLVLIIPTIIVGLIIKFTTFGAVQSVFISISGLLVSWIYFVWMTNKYQATLGKRALGIQVVSDKSENLSLGQVILRETIGKFISMVILFIGYIMAGFTKRKQALHDKIASTLVVYKDPNKKVTVWIIVIVIIASLLILAVIIGILVSIVLVSLNSARNKAQDAATKANISSVIPVAIMYQDNRGTLKGFVPNFGVQFKKCTGNPIVNISPDGQNMAIFAKLCDPKSESKYFCDDLNSNSAEVDENYAKSGKTLCPGTKSLSKETNNSTNTSSTISVDSNGLFNNVTDDVAMINVASETAKKWQPDAQAYLVMMITGEDLNNEHTVVFKSKNKPGKMFIVLLDLDNNVVGSREKQDQLGGEAGYIGIASLKYSSAKALKTSEDLIQGKLKNPITDYDKIFSLVYTKEASANVWIYTLANKKIESVVAKVLVDASSGNVLGSSIK